MSFWPCQSFFLFNSINFLFYRDHVVFYIKLLCDFIGIKCTYYDYWQGFTNMNIKINITLKNKLDLAPYSVWLSF